MISASPIFSKTLREGGSSSVAHEALIEAPKRHLVAQIDHLGVHADRQLVDERIAIGAGDIDRHDLAFGKGLHGAVERQRYSQPTRNQVHGASRQDRQRLFLAHQHTCRRGSGAVAAAGQQDIGMACGCLGERGLDVLAGHQLDVDAMPSLLKRRGHPLAE